MASIPVDPILDPVHRGLLDLAIRNVLGTERALETFAQIADGLPLSSVARDGYVGRPFYLNHPAVTCHTSLCPGAREAALAFLYEFSLGRTLTFDKALLRAYQWTPPGLGRSFECRLIELGARAVHGLAVLLFKYKHRIHDVVWAAKDPTHTIDAVMEQDPAAWDDPSPFCHPEYDLANQYPEGVSDVVGYWAENRKLKSLATFFETNAILQCERICAVTKDVGSVCIY